MLKINYIQLYANIHDIIMTEDRWVHPVKHEQLADKDEWNHWTYDTWLESIHKAGIKYQAKIHPSGHISDGNFRVWCARHLFEQNNINNWQWAMIPIDLQFFIGVQRTGNIFNIRNDFWQYLSSGAELNGIPVPPNIYTKRKAVKMRKQFLPINESDLGHGSHAYGRVNNQTHLTTKLYDPWSDK